MPENPNKPDQPEEADEEVVTLDEGDVICIDTDGNEIPIDDALAEPTDPDMYLPQTIQEHVPAFESLKNQLGVVFTGSNSGRAPELPAKNPLTCILDGMKVPVRKAVRIAQSRGTLTSAETTPLSALIDVNLLNANISVAQAIEIAERPGVLTPSEAVIFKTFKEINPNGTNVPIRQAVRAIQKRRMLTNIELELLQSPLIKIADIWLDESLRSAAKYTASGSHPEAIARMERRIADPFALTANVCLLENGHKKKERVSLAELIIIYEDVGLISPTDAVAQTTALTAKLAKLRLTPKAFERKFTSSKKNRIKDEDVQRRISIINETIDSLNEVSHYVLNKTTRTYEEVSMGDMIADLFKELDLLPEDEEMFRTPLEKKYDSKLERLGLTREGIRASIPTRLNHLDETPSSLSVFEILIRDVEETADDQNPFTTCVEISGDWVNVPILAAIALAVEVGAISGEAAKSLSRKCKTAMRLASQKPRSQTTKAVIADHEAHAKAVWARVRAKTRPLKKLPAAPSTAELLEAQVAESEREIGNNSFHPLRKILEARVADKITHEQTKALIIRTVEAYRRKNADSVIEAYSFVGLILRLRNMQEALELLDLLPILEEDKQEAKELLPDGTPSTEDAAAASDPADSDEFSTSKWGLTLEDFSDPQTEIDDNGARSALWDLERAAILSSLQKTVKSPLAIVSATAAAAMLLLHIAIELREKSEQLKEDPMETSEIGPNGEIIIKDEAGSIIAVYSPEPEEDFPGPTIQPQVAIATPSISDTIISLPEDIIPPTVVQTSTPLPEEATATLYASAIPDTFTGKPETFTGKLIASPSLDPQPASTAQPTQLLTEKPVTASVPQLDAKTLEALQSTATEALQATKTTTSKLAVWAQAKIDITKAKLEELGKQIAEFRLRPQTPPRLARTDNMPPRNRRSIETSLSTLPRLAETESRQSRYTELAEKVIPRPQTQPRLARTDNTPPSGRRPIETSLSTLPRLAETELRRDRNTELAEIPTPQIDPQTVKMVQGIIQSAITEISHSIASTAESLTAWVQAKINIAKAELEKLNRQIAEFRLRPQASPRQAETASVRLHERLAIENTLSAIPQEPQQVAQAQPAPSQTPQPASPQPQAKPPQPAPQKPTTTPVAQPDQPQLTQHPQPASPETTETPETIEVQIPIATAKTNLGFIVDSTKSYALWRARGWQGSFTRTDAGAVFTIIIPDKKTGKTYRASIPPRYTSAQKTVSSTASLIK